MRDARFYILPFLYSLFDIGMEISKLVDKCITIYYIIFVYILGGQMLTQAQAARLIGVSRQAVHKMMNDKPTPAFIVTDPATGKRVIDDEHPDWIAKLERLKNSAKLNRGLNKAKSMSHKATQAIKREQKKSAERVELNEHKIPSERKIVRMAKEMAAQEIEEIPEDNLLVEASVAENKKRIYLSLIAAEKAKQEQLKTAIQKKELMPAELMKHYFSFAENMIQTLYRRPNEIWPDVEALVLGKESKKATQKVVRELVGIVEDNIKMLREELSKEGYKVKKGGGAK